MDANKISEEKFKVYVDAMRRCRWYFLSSTFLATLILIHMYVEQYSFQEQQIRQMLQERHADDHALLQLKVAIEQGSPIDWKKYSELRYKELRRASLEQSVGIPDRSLPLLGLSVPGNDYLPIMGAMLSIIVVGIWLNLRSVASMLGTLHLGGAEQKSLRELVRFHFIFTGPIDVPAWEKGIASFTRMVAIWFPTAIFGASVFLDIRSIICSQISGEGFFPSDARVYVAYAILGVEFCLIALFALLSHFKGRDIHSLATSENANNPD